MGTPPSQPAGDSEEDGPIRPPVPADDRLWRHPSEMKDMSSTTLPALDGTKPSRAWQRKIAKTLAGSVLLSAAVWSLIVSVNSASGNDSAGRIVTTASRMPSTSRVPIDTSLLTGAMRAVRQSVVGISAMTVSGQSIEGSGVIVSTSGLVLTASSLVGAHRSVAVEMQDGRVIEGTVEGTDRDAGLALINIPLTNLDPVQVAASTPASPGEFVFALGAPGPSGGAPPIAVGSISAVGRPVSIKDMTVLGAMTVDVPLAGRAVGGVIVDRYGRLVGISLGVLNGTKGTLDIAAPASLAQMDVQQLSSSHTVSHGWLGITSNNSTVTSAGLSGGVYVASVVQSGPAQKAGIRTGDVICEINHVTTPSMAVLQQEIRLRSPGQTVSVTVKRGNVFMHFRAVLSSDDA